MSKYHSNMTNLDEAFKTARENFLKAKERAEAAEERIRELERNMTMNAAEKKIAVLRVRADKAEAEAAMNTAWDNFHATKDKIINAVRGSIESEAIAKPEDIDGNACKLLESEIMTLRDFEHMAEENKGNTTMLRLISKYAIEAMNKAEDRETKLNFRKLIESIKTDSAAKLEALKVLETVCNVCTGRGQNGTERKPPELIEKMARRWEELTADIIENF